MWKDTHLAERDMEMRVNMEAHMNSRLREAEQWRLARRTQSPSRTASVLLSSFWNRIADTVRPWLEVPPEPQEECC
jgi:hypothetical protein